MLGVQEAFDEVRLVREVPRRLCWDRTAERCSVVLELCKNVEELSGYWLFASGAGLESMKKLCAGLFTLVLGPRRWHAGAHVQAVLTFIEASSCAAKPSWARWRSRACSGCRREREVVVAQVLRRAWSQECDGVLYDASTGHGGAIEVDGEEGIVVHRQRGEAGELRWRVLRMA